MATSDSTSARRELLEALLAKVDDEPYPSPTMLDTIESLLEPRERPEYVEALIERIRADRYPSHSMIRRVCRFC